MGNVYNFCCQKENDNYKAQNETDLSNKLLANNNIVKPINVNSFQKIFEEKLQEFGEYSSTTDLIEYLPNKIKETMNSNPFDISQYSTNNPHLYSTKPIKFKNGNVYEGTWNEQIEMEGYGKLYLQKDNIFIEGFWRNGIMLNGRVYFPNGDLYEGNIENSLFHGKGTLISSNGAIYKGDFNYGERCGTGIQIFPDGSEYSGDFKDDIIYGQGDFRWANGYRYIGTFEKGQLCGKGMLTYEENKSIYEGGFYKNKFHGDGVFTWGKSGNTYRGKYDFGVKHGKGEYKKPNGFLFIGGFINGMVHGNGEIRDGVRIIKCCWRNGQTVEKPVIDFVDQENSNFSRLRVVNLDWIPEKEDLLTSKLQYLERDEDEKLPIGSGFLPTEQFTE